MGGREGDKYTEVIVLVTVEMWLLWREKRDRKKTIENKGVFYVPFTVWYFHRIVEGGKGRWEERPGLGREGFQKEV